MITKAKGQEGEGRGSERTAHFCAQGRAAVSTAGPTKEGKEEAGEK